MKIAYIVADWKKPVTGPLGPAVHIQEICEALAGRGHDVFIVAANRGSADDASQSAAPIHEIRPALPGVLRRLGPRVTHRGPAKGSRAGGLEPGADHRHARANHQHTTADHRDTTADHREAGADHGHARADHRDANAPTWRIGVLVEDVLRRTGERLWFRYFLARARRLLRDREPDALYERYDRGSPVGARLARELGLPLIVEMNHSLTFTEQWRNRHTPLYVTWAKRAERAICRAADRLSIVSPSLERYLTALGVPPDKVVLVPCAAEPERYQGIDAAVRQVRSSWGLQGGPVIGFVGSFQPWFDLDLLLDAFERARRLHPSAKLLLVGDGEKRASLEARVRDEGLSACVVFTGYIPRHEVPAYIGAMDVTVVTYPVLPDFDFLPLKVFEYMAASKPVIASATPAMRSVVEHGQNGLLVPQDDVSELAAALLRLLGDEALRRRLGEAARQTIADRFTWDRHAQRIDAMFEEVIGERSAGPHSRARRNRGTSASSAPIGGPQART